MIFCYDYTTILYIFLHIFRDMLSLGWLSGIVSIYIMGMYPL